MDNFNITGLGKSAQLSGLQTGALFEDALGAQDSALAGEAKEAAAKFEALLATTLVKEMRKTLPEGFFGSGAGSMTGGSSSSTGVVSRSSAQDQSSVTGVTAGSSEGWSLSSSASCSVRRVRRASFSAWSWASSSSADEPPQDQPVPARAKRVNRGASRELRVMGTSSDAWHPSRSGTPAPTAAFTVIMTAGAGGRVG